MDDAIEAVEELAGQLCDAIKPREIAGALEEPLYFDSASHVQAYWQAVAQTAIEAHLEWLKATGFAVVPVEPTKAMLDEGCLHWTDMDAEQAARDIYRAMIAAPKGDG